jgi:hypothetical protein
MKLSGARSEEFRGQLDLIDHHEPVMLDEACGVIMSRAGGGRVIQQDASARSS